MPTHLLLADDHLLVRQGLRVLLEQAGMVVVGEASDGAEALQLAHTHQPEVAILDIAMPHMNGLETALYRIMQEGLTNITKHAAATHVDLRLWQDGEMVHGLLRDDGVGFVVEHVVGQTGPRGLGLLGIRERLEALGGTLQIISAPGQGTTLQIMLPAATPDPGAGGALPQDLWQFAGAH